MQTTSDTGFKLKFQIEFFYATYKKVFVIFDRDVEKIIDKFARDLAKKQIEVQLI